MSHNCFIHSSTDGHLSFFHILGIVSNVVMDIGVLMFFRISALGSSGYIPRSGIAGLKGIQGENEVSAIRVNARRQFLP